MRTKSLTYNTSLVVGITTTAAFVVLALSMLIPTYSNAQTDDEDVIFSDDFESGNLNNWTSNIGWRIVNDGVNSAADSNGLTQNGKSTLTERAPTDNFGDTKLSFDFMLSNLGPDDMLKVQIFENGKWRTVKNIDNNRPSTARDFKWNGTTIDLPDSINEDDAFRFRFVSNIDKENGRIQIDNVELRGTPIDLMVMMEDDNDDFDEITSATDTEDVINDDVDDTNINENEINDTDDTLNDENDDDFNNNLNNINNSVNNETPQKITVTLWNNHASIEFDYSNTSRTMQISETGRNAIISKITDELNMTEDEVRDRIEFVNQNQ